MWIVTRSPASPFANLAVSVVLGSVVASTIYSFSMLINMNESGLSLAHVFFGGLTSVILSPLYGLVYGFVFTAPLLWIALRLGLAGPVTSLAIACLLSGLLGLWDLSKVLFPLITTIIFIRLSYVSGAVRDEGASGDA